MSTRTDVNPGEPVMPLFQARYSLDGSEYLIRVEAGGIAEAAEALVAAGADVRSVTAAGPDNWRNLWRQSPFRAACGVLAVLLMMNCAALVLVRGVIGRSIAETDNAIVVPAIVIVAVLGLVALTIGVVSGFRGSRRSRVGASELLGLADLRATSIAMPKTDSSALWRGVRVFALPGFVAMAAISLVRFWRAEPGIVDAAMMLAVSAHMLWTYGFTELLPDLSSRPRQGGDHSTSMPAAEPSP